MKETQIHVKLSNANFDHLPLFEEMEREADAAKYITGYSLPRHEQEFRDPSVSYKAILNQGNVIVGFLILSLDKDPDSIELRRIVVSDRGKGIGRNAIEQIDHICTTEFDRLRIWLDVFDYNDRAKRLYESCGYKKISESNHEKGKLLIYEKYPNKAAHTTPVSAPR